MYCMPIKDKTDELELKGQSFIRIHPVYLDLLHFTSQVPAQLFHVLVTDVRKTVGKLKKILSRRCVLKVSSIK